MGMTQSPGQGSNLEDCKKSCQNNADCKSIVLLKNGWCSHYSTPCTNTKKKGKVLIAMRLVAESGSSPTTTQKPSMAWEQVQAKTVCDTNEGEVYMRSSPGKLSSLEQCQMSCESNTGCKSIIFFKNGLCSHFSTTCSKVKTMKKAAATWRVAPNK